MTQLNNFFKNKKILITGHTGFKGSWLVEILLYFGSEVIGYALKPASKPNLFSILNLEKRIKNYYGDVRDYKKLREVIRNEKPDIIFHLAAQALVRESYYNPRYTYETNIMGTVNILEAIRTTRSVKSVIMVTTDKVYENKEWIWKYRENDELGGYDPYSTSKACDELIINSYIRSFFNTHNLKDTSTFISSVRAGNVIGEGDWSKDRIMTDIMKSIFEKGEIIKIRNPNAIRPWQHVLDVLYGYLLLSKQLYEKKHEFIGPWNIAPDDKNLINVENLVKKVIKITKKGEYKVLNREIKNLHEAQTLKLDNTKAKEILKWKCYLDIDNALKWTVQWYEKYYSQENMLRETKKQIEKYFMGVEDGWYKKQNQ